MSRPGAIYSNFKIFHHPQTLAALAEGRRSAPVHIRLKPTNTCNHHCGYCTYGLGQDESRNTHREPVRKNDFIARSKMRELTDDLVDLGVKAVTFSGGGEPLTYQWIGEAVERLRAGGVDLSLITNGQLLQGPTAQLFAQAKWVRISFDSPDPEEYARLRRIAVAGFHQVCDNIASFAKIKSGSCVLGINFVVGLHNCRRVYEALGLLKELGVDNVKLSALIANAPGYHAGIKDDVLGQISRAAGQLADDNFSIVNAYKAEFDDRNFTPPPFDRCLICRLTTAIAADSKLYLCHTRAYDARATIGDISERSFREVWFSAETRAASESVNPTTDCRNYCVYEDRNAALENYLNVEANHVNFL